MLTNKKKKKEEGSIYSAFPLQTEFQVNQIVIKEIYLINAEQKVKIENRHFATTSEQMDLGKT